MKIKGKMLVSFLVVILIVLTVFLWGIVSVQFDKVAEKQRESLGAMVDEQRKELKASGLGISGFFDVNASNCRNNPNAFALGDFEFKRNSIEHIVFLEFF